jgi:hypothetical protein
MKLTEKEQKIARLALDKGAKDGERQAAAAKLIDSLCARGVTVEDIEKESVHVEYHDRMPTETAYRNRPAPPTAAPCRSKPRFSVVAQVLPFKTPEARENARLRCLAMLEERNQIERERIALSDQGLFRSTASIEIHWREIKVNERLIVAAMRAGHEKLADLARRELKRMQNELLRATGWPVNEPETHSAPEPVRAPQPTTSTKCYDQPSVKAEPERSHVWTWIPGVAAAFAILLIVLTFAHSNSTSSPEAQPTSPSQLTWEAKDSHPDVRTVAAASVPKALPVERGELPDRAKTPGEIFEGVTVDDLRQPGYSKRARQVPVELEREIYAWYGISDHAGFVIDHLVPVELAGRSTLANLWPQRVEEAKRKERLAAKLHDLVLSGQLELGTAQREIAANWIEAYKKYVSP